MQSVQPLSSEQLQSKVISFLRFPLIVGVVMIHVNMAVPQGALFPIYHFTKELTSSILAAIAVPMFFMFSGFLFFYKLEDFTLGVYKEKIKKRIKSLLVPYLFWNSMFILYYLAGRMLGLGSQYGVDFTFIDWLRPYWNANEAHGATGDLPVSIQFWYIRDLLVIILLSPIVYWLTKKLRYGLTLLLGVLWLTDSWQHHVTGLSITALTFFSLGAYFSIHKINFVEIVKSHTLLLGIFYAISVIIVLILKYSYSVLLNRIGILLGMAFIISLAARFLANEKWHVNGLLTESSFFIFAYHMLALVIIEEVFPLHLSFNTDIMYAVMYVAWVVVTVLVGLFVYYILKKWFPRFTAFITGGR
ncbi:MAG: acyltransferase family protein [Bacteroidaceae bacterium]|nr:acyltransferase family protein [Bacteroidaceae bacterium]MBQ3238456.1 acyltransferase family protein [Bacteroidaceae bacterium]